MTKIAYEEWDPKPEAVAIVRIANQICAEYGEQGYDLTLRQLYYQFVARDLLPNRMQAYKRLGDIVNHARMAGLMDWSYIVDRTRSLRGTSHWNSPSSVIESAARGYRRDKWVTQPVRVEVWVEKEALAGIVERSAAEHDVDWFACRGYVSQSEQWAAAQRHFGYLSRGQRVVVLHLGDHDPSGIDMTRDIRDRLNKFLTRDWYNKHNADIRRMVAASTGQSEKITYADVLDHIDSEADIDGHDPIEVRRIALNFDQVEQYDPPPNPAKLTDSRANGYVEQYGPDSWELDALDPTVLAGLITDNIEGLRDDDAYDALADREQEERAALEVIAEQYDEIAEQYGPNGDGE